eukprot:906376-Prorocentrum_minimum.AAC.2
MALGLRLGGGLQLARPAAGDQAGGKGEGAGAEGAAAGGKGGSGGTGQVGSEKAAANRKLNIAKELLMQAAKHPELLDDPEVGPGTSTNSRLDKRIAHIACVSVAC